jgi:four helix bundle protein
MNKGKIESSTDLEAWREGYKLVLEIYKISQTFPAEERFGLTNQIRRAAVSVTSNIAEGFSRESYKEKVQFYSMAKGSLTELQNQLLIARDVDYIAQDAFGKLAEQSVTVHKLLTGLVKSSKKRSR